MKNNVWVAISFSMLAAAVTAEADQAQNSKGTNQDQSSVEAETVIEALQINQKPDFEKPLPCYAQKK